MKAPLNRAGVNLPKTGVENLIGPFSENKAAEGYDDNAEV